MTRRCRVLAAVLALAALAAPVFAGSIRAQRGHRQRHSVGKHGTGGVVMVDGGSSGSKLFSFSAPAPKSVGGGPVVTDLKILSKCTVSPDKQPLLGVSSYAYDELSTAATKPCQSEVENDAYDAATEGPALKGYDGAKPEDHSAEEYAKFLLRQLKFIHEKRPTIFEESTSYPCDASYVVNGACPAADNRQNIPFMATAGMRLLTKEENDAVWNKICGTEEDGYKFAEKGSECGTIPGTQEAYFEWLANIAKGEHPQVTGTFTIGGASAQIAFPLMNEHMVAAWRDLITLVEGHYKDCSKIYLPGTETKIPIFSSGHCARDFVDIRMAKDIKLTPALKARAGIAKIQAVALVSFLGLRGQGGSVETGVAGGANLVGGTSGSWAAANSCVSGEGTTFTNCLQLMKERLKGDFLFQRVKEFFHNKQIGVNHFSYNTPAAIPSFSFNKKVEDEARPYRHLQKMEDPDSSKIAHLAAGHVLEKTLNEFCKTKFSGFGFAGKNNCMKASWTGLYASEFFDTQFIKHTFQSVAKAGQKEKDKLLLTRQKRHGLYADLHFSPLDWSEGAYQDSAAKAAKVESGASSLDSDEGGSETPSQDSSDLVEFFEVATSMTPRKYFHSHSYLEGVALHLAAKQEQEHQN